MAELPVPPNSEPRQSNFWAPHSAFYFSPARFSTRHNRLDTRADLLRWTNRWTASLTRLGIILSISSE